MEYPGEHAPMKDVQIRGFPSGRYSGEASVEAQDTLLILTPANNESLPVYLADWQYFALFRNWPT